jgi:hypothetical protein
MPSVGAALTWVGRIAAAVIGLLLIYVAFFLSEDEEGRLENSLEHLWRRIEEAQSLALSLQAAFLQQVARTSTLMLDSVFGARLLSWRAISVSGCLSLASVVLVGTLGVALISAEGIGNDAGPFLVGIAAALVLIGLALLPALSSRTQFAAVPVVAFPLATIVLVVALAGDTDRFYILPSIALGIPSDFLFIAIGRRLLTLIQRSADLIKLIALLIATLALPAIVFLLPLTEVIMRGSTQPPEQGISPRLLTVVGIWSLSNGISAFICFIFAALVTLALLHRLIWPLLRRPAMAAHRHGLLKQRKLLWTIGVGLIAVSTPLGGRAMAYLHSHFGL